MTVVLVFPKQHMPDGEARPIRSGRIWFAKHGRTLNGEVVIPATPWSEMSSIPLRGAEISVSLTAGYWKIWEQFDGGVTRYVSVPDSTDPVDYADLIDVDPESLDPTAEPEAAWWLALQDVIDGLGSGSGGSVTMQDVTDAIQDHSESETPHPAYDDLPDLTLIVENHLL